MISLQPHTGSYYAASANEIPDYSPLQGAKSSDVCVIGAGFTGLSAALHLAERGFKVHVIEANKVAWGASGRNGGQMIGGISGENRISKSLGANGESIVWDMRWKGHQIIRERVETYGIQCDLKSGYLDVAIKPRHVQGLEAEFTELKRHNFPFEIKLLSKQEIQDTIGTNAYIGGLLNMGNGHPHQCTN
jgi:glycine/D-amino acid oxidase-like deaminating enzyme